MLLRNPEISPVFRLLRNPSYKPLALSTVLPQASTFVSDVMNASVATFKAVPAVASPPASFVSVPPRPLSTELVELPWDEKSLILPLALDRFDSNPEVLSNSLTIASDIYLKNYIVSKVICNETIKASTSSA